MAYFALSLYFLFFHDFQYLIDPDSTSYISIAQKYLTGNFTEAVNAHWSPLTSWLLLPLLLLKIRPMLALDISAIIVGGLTLTGVNLLLRAIGIRDKIRFFYVLALTPLITLYALTEGNPDLLCACVLIYYINIMIREDFKTNRYRGILAGLLGAVAFLAKSYNFYFFLLHFSCFVLLYWFNSSTKSNRKTLVTNGVSGFLVFLLISSIWIGLLTQKYHTFTVSTAGSYNFSFTRPGSPGQMVDTDGLLPLPNKTAFSAWEDPTFIPKVPWSPFKSLPDFLYFTKKTITNVGTYLLYISRNHILFFTIIYFIAIVIPLRLRSPDKSFYLFLTTILHPIGYLMLLVEERYFWFDYILLYILSAFILDTLLKKTDLTRLQEISLLSIIFFYMVTIPLLHINSSEENLMHLKKIYFTSNAINKYYDLRNVNIASQGENWSDDLYLSYYLHARYYGKVKEHITDEQLKEKLISYDIQYYFVHGKLKNHIDILKPDKQFGDITIYKIVNRVSTRGGLRSQVISASQKQHALL